MFTSKHWPYVSSSATDAKSSRRYIRGKITFRGSYIEVTKGRGRAVYVLEALKLHDTTIRKGIYDTITWQGVK